jgi:RHS repeat-associated protein
MMMIGATSLQALTTSEILEKAQNVRERVKPLKGSYQERVIGQGITNVLVGKMWMKGDRKKIMQTYPYPTQTLTKENTIYTYNQVGSAILTTTNTLAEDLTTYPRDYSFIQTETSSHYILTGTRLAPSQTLPIKVELTINKSRNTLDQEIYWTANDATKKHTRIERYFEVINTKYTPASENITTYATDGITPLEETQREWVDGIKINQTFPDAELMLPGESGAIFPSPNMRVIRSLTGETTSMVDNGTATALPSPTTQGEAYLAPANLYQSGDIELTQGTLRFQEEDLVLPGKNGLDVKIVRQYNSRNMRSLSRPDLEGLPWAGWLSHGWSIGFAQRAYIIKATKIMLEAQHFTYPKDKIAIETGEGMQIYSYDASKDCFTSAEPGNFCRAYYNPTTEEIRLITDAGQTWTFTEPYYTEEQKVGDEDVYPDKEVHPLLTIKGYYVTSVTDLNNNRVSYRYDTFAEPINPYNRTECDRSDAPMHFGNILKKSILGAIADTLGPMVKYMEHLPLWHKGHFKGYTGKITVTQKRPSKITDTFGRDITFSYQDSWSYSRSETSKSMITGITYKGSNGQPMTIKYVYDTNENLVSAQLGNLPAKTYGYDWHNPTYKEKWELIPFSSGLRVIRIIDFDTNSNLDFDVKKYQGYVLQSIQNALGSKVVYRYESSLQHVSGDKFGIAPEASLAVSHPVITQKRIYESQSDTDPKTYTIIYPRDSKGRIRNVRAGMPPRIMPLYGDKARLRQYYFPQVTIDNPNELEDETTYFDQGLPIKKVQGIQSQETEWDFTKMQQLKSRNKINNITQTETIYESYDGYNNPTSVLMKNGSIPYQRTTTTYVLNQANNLLHNPEKITVKELTTNREKSSFTTYTQEGKPYEVYEGTSTSGKKQKTLTYDAIGRLTQETTYGPAGSFTLSTSYSGGDNYTPYVITQSQNGKTTTTRYEPNTGRPIQHTNANGATSQSQYDDYGRPIQQTDAEGQVTTLTYSSDLKTTTLTSGGRTTTKITDNLGRLIETRYPIGEEDEKIEYYFSTLPKAIYKKQNNIWVAKQTITYDTYLRKQTTTDPNWGTTRYTYNDITNTVQVTDPTGRSSQTQKNMLGQVIVTTGVDGLITRYTYDGFGNTINVEDPRGLGHESTYDNYGRITTSYHTHNARTPRKPRSETTYYDNGQVKQTIIKNEDGTIFRTYTYAYDQEGRLTQTQVNGTTTETLTYDTAQNGRGAIASAENKDSRTHYAYDLKGRITQETVTVKPINRTYTIQTAYNLTNGQIASTTFPDGKAISYAYDTNQKLTEIKYTSNPSLITYTYNPNGTVQSMRYANGITTTYTYTKDILLTDLVTRKADNTILYEQHYSYDNRGNVKGTGHNDYITNKPGIQRAYTYTIKDELKTVAITTESPRPPEGGVVTYTHNYDGNGNILRFETAHNKGVGENNISIDANHDRIREKRYQDGKVLKFEYDAAGNLTEKRRVNPTNRTDETITYIYNDQDQLSAIQNETTRIADYGYDHKRQRIYSNHPGPQTYDGEKIYYWDLQGRIIGEENQSYSQSNAATVRYIYSGNQKVAMARPKNLNNLAEGEDMFYFINNAQGTPVMIVDAAQNPVSKINLDEWGNEGIIQGSEAEINFTGKKLDAKTCLYYFNQRYYDPEIGRFLTEDPAGQCFNPYLYCGNNPLVYTDPDGQFFGWDDAIYAAIAYAITEGAKAAAINVALQLVANGGHTSKINWNAVGNSFITAGTASLLGAGGGIFKPGGSDVFSYALAHGLNNGITNVAVNWATGKGGNVSKQFYEGLKIGAAAGVAKWVYHGMVGYRPRMESGVGVFGENGIPHRALGENAAEWLNVVGNPIDPETNPPGFINDILPGRENGFISNIVNFLPGGNSFAQLHDNLDSLWGMGLERGYFKDVWSFMLFAPALAINYGALYPEFSYYY